MKIRRCNEYRESTMQFTIFHSIIFGNLFHERVNIEISDSGKNISLFLSLCLSVSLFLSKLNINH